MHSLDSALYSAILSHAAWAVTFLVARYAIITFGGVAAGTVSLGNGFTVLAL